MEKLRTRLPPTAALAMVLMIAQAALPQFAAEPSPISSSRLPVEDPASLLDIELGGADAELLVKGSWEARLAAQGALEFGNSRAGLSSLQPLLFSQSPDLYLSFLLFKKYFVEAHAVDDFSQARYSFGYRGAEGETLEEIRAGNDRISFPEFPFLSFGGGSYRSLGIAAATRAPGFAGDAMIRYDQAQRVSKRYSGGSELADTVLPAQAFIRGRWFATPQVGWTNLVLYVGSLTGPYSDESGRRYRVMEEGEYSYSSSRGLIALARASQTRVAARYAAPSNAGELTIGGEGCILLFDPETPENPGRQILCRYPTNSDPARSEAFVRDTASGLVDPAYELRIDASGFAELTRSSYLPVAGIPLEQAYTRPFEYDPPDHEFMWIYWTDLTVEGPADYAPAAPREIVIRTRSAVDAMTIDADYIEGSLEIRRDGAPEYAFIIDPERRTVELASLPGPYELIELSYLRASSERRTGSLAAGLAGNWSLGEGREAWAALGLRWSLPGLGYGAADAVNPGSLILTGGERDSEGNLTHRAALAASYGKSETSGRYRIEGMESSGEFATAFRPTASSYPLPDGFSATETLDEGLKESFPRLAATLHADGSAQRALRLSAAAADWSASLATIVETPRYASFGSFSFYVMTRAAVPGAGTILRLSLDEGFSSSGAAARVELPLEGFPTGAWRKIVMHYGDDGIYAQDAEQGALSRIGTLGSLFDPTSSASRILIEVVDAAAGQEIWVDELALEESAGTAAILFQGEVAYRNASLRLGGGKMSLVEGIDAKADLSAAYSADPYASGGASLATVLGPLGLKLKARASASADGGASASGGHEATLPQAAFPIRITDRFDFDPADGAFGKGLLLSLAAGDTFGLDIEQDSTWEPASPLARGKLEQAWSAALKALEGRIRIEVAAANRARPAAGPELADSGYGRAWLDSFSLVLPAYESDSDRRSESAALALSFTPSAELLSASFAVESQPGHGSPGRRRNSVAIGAGLPFVVGGITASPYYRRSWTEERSGAGEGMLGDLSLALGDFIGMAPLYSPEPFVELAADGLSGFFAESTEASDYASALFAPEAGFILAREYGSRWYDLLLPSSLSLAYRRELERKDDSLTDAGVWEASIKTAAINLFGSMGSYPISLLFDSDEYLFSSKVALRDVAGESAPRLSLQAQQLATFLAGEYDSLDAENRVYVSKGPDKSEWSETLALVLSRRVARHWLIDLYRRVVPAARAPGRDANPAGSGSGERTAGPAVASRYLAGLAEADPKARDSFGLDFSLKRAWTDASDPDPSWSIEEYYEAKLTVPEMLTIAAKAAMSQARDGVDGVLSFGVSLSLGLTLSF